MFPARDGGRLIMKVQCKPLREQVIVITGATSGIGLVTARHAAKRGARLVLAARNGGALQQLCAELNGKEERACYAVADVADEAQVRSVGELALHRFGGFDTWMNVAGVGIFGKNEDVSIVDMRRLFDVNFWGVVHGSLEAVRHLKTHGGVLINMGSETADSALPLQGAYSASKHAVKGFTDSLRAELEEARTPVAVVLVKPGSVDTMFVSHAANYLSSEPRLPPPIYAPELVADALLHAAVHPSREVYVGGHAKLMATAAHHAPGLLERGLARFMGRYLRSGRPGRNRNDHALYVARTDLRERGKQDWPTHEHSLYTQAAMHPTAMRAALLTGITLIALWQARRRA